MKKIRDFQQEGITKVFDALKNGIKRQLMVYATGLGKTFTSTCIMKEFKRTLWITHVEELIIQSARAIVHENPTATVGIIKQERFDIDHDIVVASIQTLHRRLEKIDPNTFDCIVIDEAHLAMAPTWLKAIGHFKPKLLLGLTATPERLDGISLGNLFDQITIEKGIDYGIQEGYLVELEGVRVSTNVDLDKVRTTAGELNSGDLSRTINTPERNRQIVSKWQEYCPDTSTIAFCVDMKHAQDLCEAFNNKGISSRFVVSDERLCPDRKEVIAGFKRGDFKVLTNVMILTAGFDHPPVETIITARPTKSKTVFLQQVGRGTRPIVDVSLETKDLRREVIKLSGKKKCTILDIVDATNRHQLINTFTLDKDKPLEEKTFMLEEVKQEIAFKVARQRKLEKERKADEKVNLIKLPEIKINNSPAMQEPATEKQLKWLKDLGYDVENIIYTKRDCSELISNSPAYKWQVDQLARNGYDVSKGVKLAQAKIAIEELLKKHAKTTEPKLQINVPFKGLK